MQTYTDYTPSPDYPQEVLDWAYTFLDGLDPDPVPAAVDGQVAPSSNTGISLTSSEASSVFLDWVAFTVPADVVTACAPDYAIEDVASLTGLGSVTVELLPRGWLGYSHCLCVDGLPGARIGFGGQRGTVYVSLSSGALGWYVARGLDWRGWLKYLHDLGVKFTRCDFAFDDHAGLVTLERVRECLDRGGDVRVSRMTRAVGGAFIGRGDDWTVYLGGRSSQRLVRIYNKAAEQGLPVSWVRVEIEVKGDAAAACMGAWILADFSVRFLLGYLRSTVDFRDPGSGGVNSSRWPMCDWWRQFVQACGIVRVVVAKMVHTVATIRAWYERCMTGVTGLMAAQYGFDYVRKVASRGMGNLSPYHFSLLRVAGGAVR